MQPYLLFDPQRKRSPVFSQPQDQRIYSFPLTGQKEKHEQELAQERQKHQKEMKKTIAAAQRKERKRMIIAQLKTFWNTLLLPHPHIIDQPYFPQKGSNERHQVLLPIPAILRSQRIGIR